jgi:hypothetical protein
MPVHARSKLRGTIVQLASDFAEGVLEALRNVSLEDLLAEASAPSSARSRAPAARPRSAEPPVKAERKRGRRLARRSPADIARVVDRIVALLAEQPKGLRSEQIQARLGLAAKEMPRPLADALAARRITRRGQKRATTYLAVASGAPKAVATSARPATKAPKKAGRSAPRKAAPRKQVSAKRATAPKKPGSKQGKRPSRSPKKAAATPAKPVANAAHAAPGAAS